MKLANKQLVAGGAYARKQLFCKNRVVAWSHGTRFRLGRRLAEPYAGRKLLDYGCGDGTFLALVHDLFPVAVGADVDPKQTADCVRRFAHVPGLSFMLTESLADPCHDGGYGVIVCMEVIEHCTEEKVQELLRDLARLLAHDGRAVISVPVEIGPSLLGKQFIRMLAGLRGLGDYRYRETYRWSEIWKMVLAGEGTAITRPAYRTEFIPGQTTSYHGHKGFNWRTLRRQLEVRLQIERICFSPLGWLGGYCSSQAWFVCKLP
jgi:2-polyprenyl-3-methyl-5-hydroxy-6-metoxy-1,4-benzoquinol methylase